MDTIGLLAAWTGVLSILSSLLIAVAVYLATPLFQKWWAASTPDRAAGSLENLPADLALRESAGLGHPDLSYIARLISLYGALVLNLVAGTALVIVSIEILDLGPALLAAVLPFNINPRILTRITGLALLAGSYIFIFRLSYLVVKLRLLTFHGDGGYPPRALREISQLRQVNAPNRKSAAASGLTRAGVK
jgi:hypothetical protein